MLERLLNDRLEPWLNRRCEIFDIRKEPDGTNGGRGVVYMRRWYLIKSPWFGVKVHKFFRSDADRDVHDHPWWFVSVILTMGYFEQEADGKVHWRPRFIPRYRPATKPHRVMLRSGNGQTPPVWTICITGPDRGRVWGYATKRGWIPYPEYLGFEKAPATA